MTERDASTLRGVLTTRVLQWVKGACLSLLTVTLSLTLLLTLVVSSAGAAPLRIVTTVPDLSDLASTIGGEEVQVTALVRGGEDPHFVQAKPSFMSRLADAELFVQVGLELEAAWIAPLLQGARNPKILPGERGFLDASKAIDPVTPALAPRGRESGDVHGGGNPHYLVDPLCGLQVARALSLKLSELRPERHEVFQRNLERFSGELGELLFGEALAKRYGVESLLILSGKDPEALYRFLSERGELGQLGGFFQRWERFKGTRVVTDHNIWPYFERRFGVQVVDQLEPFAGVPPTTRKIEEVMKTMQAQKIGLLLSAPYYDQRHIHFVAEHTGAKVVQMAHQVGSLPSVTTYRELIRHNGEALLQALE